MTIWYINDTSYFVDNFCVNKEKKEMQCHGRCHLQKQIGASEDENTTQIQISILELEYTNHSDIQLPNKWIIRTQNHVYLFATQQPFKGYSQINTPPPNV